MITLNITHFDTVTSTNDLLKEAAISGTPTGTMYIADSQTKGRGRMGRSFYSPSCTGLYMSFLLRHDDIAYDINLLTSQVAVAVSDVLDKTFTVSTGIKWVNDIYLNGLKVSGILCEGLFVGQSHYVIVGIGINLNTSVWPKDIENSAGAIIDNTLTPEQKQTLAQDIFNKVICILSEQSQNWLHIYNHKSILSGKTVEAYKIADGEDHFTAEVIEIDENAHLIVRDTYGKKHILSSGEIRIKIP